MHDNPEYVLEAVRAGAHAYLLKDLAATEPAAPEHARAGVVGLLRRGYERAEFLEPVRAQLEYLLEGRLTCGGIVCGHLGDDVGDRAPCRPGLRRGGNCHYHRCDDKCRPQHLRYQGATLTTSVHAII